MSNLSSRPALRWLRYAAVAALMEVAVALCALVLDAKNGNSLILVSLFDHFITDTVGVIEPAEAAVPEGVASQIVTFRVFADRA